MNLAIRFRTIAPALFAALCVTLCWSAAAGQNSPGAPSGPPGQITGHVYRADNNAPIAKATVTLIPFRIGNPSADQQTARTDAGGAYIFTSVNPGNYLLQAQRTGFTLQGFNHAGNSEGSEQITVGADQTVSKIDVRLFPTGVITGTIFDEDNEPMEGIRVTAIRVLYQRGGQQRESQVRSATTDDLGNIRLYGLPSGNYFVHAQNAIVNTLLATPTSHSAYYPGTPTLETAQRVKVSGGNETGNIRFTALAQMAYSITGNVGYDSGESRGPWRRLFTLSSRLASAAKPGS